MKEQKQSIQQRKQRPNVNYTNSYKKIGWPLFRKNPPFNTMPNRSIYTNITDESVCDNSIKTSKYTTINFIPKNLIIQFSKIANIYFLVIGIMQMIRSISVSGGFPVIFMPLAIVVGTSAIKDYYEDMKRKNSDQQINGKTIKVVSSQPGQQFETKKWCDLRIGSIIRVQKNQTCPADIILLASSQVNQDCFIETKNLDGETNLKYKKVKPEISAIFKQKLQTNQIGRIYNKFDYEHPNPFIHTFTGSFQKKVPLNSNNVVLRGCSLKMTNYIYGLVIYTGVDSKIMLNSNDSRQKKSRLQFKMGIIVIIIFIIQMLLTFSCALLGVATSNHDKWMLHDTSRTYDYAIQQQIQKISRAGNQLFIRWGSWILLFTNFVPISLIVSLEMVKYIQGVRISVKQPNRQIIVQTSTLNEELGQIHHLFSDKTGTLTKNYMSFKYMIAGFKVYGYGSKCTFPEEITNVQFHDQQLMTMLQKQKLTPANNQSLFDMFLAFSICHNVILQKQQDQQNKQQEAKSKKPKYNASSPDQLAFINMACFAGWQYLGTDSENFIMIKHKQEIMKYRLLHTIQFNSDRKKMSVIIQEKLQSSDNQEKSRILVYSKGADNVMFDRIKQKTNKKIEKVKQKLQEWSVAGLRTLVFAKRQIKKQYYDKWAKMYAFSLSNLQKQEVQQKSIIREMAEIQNNQKDSKNFSLSLSSISNLIIEQPSEKQSGNPKQSAFVLINKMLNDNSLLTESHKRFIDRHLTTLQKQKPQDIHGMPTAQQLQAVIEKQFQLIGATAIEDQLQDNVKITIQRLRSSGVKVWMLTGDKKQTAINIGISCGLIAQDMAVLQWKQSVLETLHQKDKYKNRQCCLVVTGQQLLSTEGQQKNLLILINQCHAIVCCRVTPKQKQDMVWLMRKNRYTTLAIGDGANDVNMINTAHVGIGIKGVQGAQAALCSDYAISQFQIVGQLMLYHGRQFYRKNSQLIIFNFYKNLLLVLPQLWYSFSNGFSPCNIYDPWIYQLYNVVYTSLPIIIYAITDQQYSMKKSLQNPQLYKVGLQNKLFTMQKVWKQLFFPIFFTFFLSTLTFAQMQSNGINGLGYTWDLVSQGMTIFLSCVIICNIKVIIISFKLSKLLILSILGSILLFFITYIMAARIFPTSQIVNSMYIYLHSLDYYLIVLINILIVTLIQIFCKMNADTMLLSEDDEKNNEEHKQIEMKMLSDISDNSNKKIGQLEYF